MSYITSIQKISAIYYALLLCGYEYYPIERDETHVSALRGFSNAQGDFSFFLRTKQDTCEAYPYWPRAAMLEMASFFTDERYTCFQNYDVLRDKIFSANNIADRERDDSFWEWLKDFPSALESVFRSTGFQAYLAWENEWVEEQNQTHASELIAIQKALDRCFKRYDLPVQDVQLVVNPIKCVYSSDYHLIGERFIFCSGRLDVSSIVHEILHLAAHPVVMAYREQVLLQKICYQGIDLSYYLAGNEAGRLNAFEEYFVRLLTEDVLAAAPPDDLNEYMAKVLLDLEERQNCFQEV